MSSQTIFLKESDDTIVNLDGMEFTIGELKEHVINSHYYQQRLAELIGGK